jgi:hypothetical protein
VIVDDTDAIAHLAFAFAFALDGDMELCRAEIERAISLNPNHTWAWASPAEFGAMAKPFAFRQSAERSGRRAW